MPTPFCRPLRSSPPPRRASPSAKNATGTPGKKRKREPERNQLGIEAQLKLGDKAAIFTPGQQLSIGLEEPNRVDLALPVGVGYQAAPNFFVAAQTQVLNVGISESDSGVIFADYLPLSLAATFSPSNTIDVGASISWRDLTGDEDVNLGISHPVLGIHGRLHM